ncbi:MAG TPA: hypothetical protein VND94_01135 [Terriglobia bacterium]|nr:hypothetical protein [Terriglobia bacterium]
MSEKMGAKVRDDLIFTLRLELSKRISPAKRRAHQIDLDILAGYLVNQIELANFVVRHGPPLPMHAVSYDLPLLNAPPGIKK